MLRFRFRLATLLRLREKERDDRRLQLADAQRALDIICTRIAQFDAEVKSLREKVSRLMQPGRVDVDQLMETQRYELLLTAERQAAEGQRRLVADEVERRRGALVVADREVRVLERLEETLRNRHQREAERQDRKELDEVAVVAFSRREK